LRVIIINGPNLNLLGTRETDIYGNESFESFLKTIQNTYKQQVDIDYYQNNVEGDIINKLHEIGLEKNVKYDGIIINAGAYTHTSIAIADAIAGIETKTRRIPTCFVIGKKLCGHNYRFWFKKL
jgi:3-dehydroquinate dehydratase-2